MISRWGALPLDDPYRDVYVDVVMCACGKPCPRGYEHCDDCLMAAVRGINAVDRAVANAKRLEPHRPQLHERPEPLTDEELAASPF